MSARYYAHYMDNGPSRTKGLSTTAADMVAWDRLYVFDAPKPWLDFIHDVGVETYRLNARVVGMWAEGDDHYEQITDWTGNKPASEV